MKTEMEEDKLPNNDVCRLCRSPEPVISIFTQGKTVLEMISSLCLVIVRENDNMPRKICIQCLKLLQQFKEFRQKCLETDRILQKQKNIVFSSDAIKTELFDNFTEGTIKTELFDNFTEGTIKIEPCDDDHFQADINSAPDNHSDSDQSEDWFEKYFTETKPKSKKQNREKQEVNHKENTHAMCYVCGNSVSRLYFTKHLLLHSTERKYCCSICHKKFKTKSTLNIHMNAHTDDRVTCDICNKNFSYLLILKRHIQVVHSAPEKVKCDICAKVFKNKLLLKSHKKRHEKRYKCQYCDSMFADSTSKREHERLHTGETPYKCPSCPKAYAQLANMKSHFKHNHKDIVFSEVYKSKTTRKKYKIITDTPKDVS